MLAVALSACGGDDGDEARAGTSADRAFLEAMIPHHESAIEMAEIAKRRADHPQVTELADAIVTAQSNEIRQIKGIHQRLFGQKIIPNPDAHEGLGLSAAEAGMAHMDSTGDLEQATPFDKAFIDEMVSHHQGAIRMARAVLDETDDTEVRSLAEAIVRAQSNEIQAMNKWRKAWYGESSPAGGAPKEGGGAGGDKSMEDSMGEHDGH